MEKMWYDVQKKTQQGMQFFVIRSHLMSAPVDYREDEEIVSVTKN